MPDAIETTERLREANHNLSTLPFYIGTSRRQVVGIALVVHLNLEHGVVAGYIAADLHGQPHQAGQRHPLAATAVALRAEDRDRVISEGALDDVGRYTIAGMVPHLRYFLHLGAE